ncbi:MAG: hypothetical protein J6J62_09240 [Oscillospiraceae bacterium]|nr:hypothetical protein [Oscillospiraceae bacterium]
MDWKNIIERAAWTFLEGFIVALPAASQLGVDAAAWKAALIGASMAGLSALKTLVLEVIKTAKGEG